MKHLRHLWLSFNTLFLVSCVSSAPVSKPIDSTVSQCALSEQSHYDWSKNKPPQLVWLSLDSLNLAGLQEIVPLLKAPHPRGLKWILESQNRNPNLEVHEPTITSSSHISTLTCSTSGVHGIFANSQWGGNKIVSGFAAPFEVETFATSLKRNGLRVVTAAYPALDNSEPGREVSEGFAYGKSYGSARVYPEQDGQLIHHSWLNEKSEVIERIALQPGDAPLAQRLNCERNRCSMNASAVEGVVDISFRMSGTLFHAYAQMIKGQPNQIFFSSLSVNSVFPESLQQSFDSCGLHFSPGKDHSLSRFGASVWVKGLQHRLAFFEQTWKRYLTSSNADVIFMYLEDIDSLRHQFAGDASATPDISLHYDRVDKVVGDLINSLPPSTNVVVMGDHGMSTIKKEINIRKIIPEGIISQLQILTSGGTLMIYGEPQKNGNLAAVPSEKERVMLEQIKGQLDTVRLNDRARKVFTKSYVKGSEAMRLAGLMHKNAPYLIAFADDDFALQNSMTSELILADVENSKMPVPRPRGQHGHARESPRMKTYLVGWGPVIDKINLSSVRSNIDVVPTLGQSFNWKIPGHCRSGKN